jgi:2-succinyl-5-enolpyruvyl-6-hydroxy-3-cyclohexene-1-carboxylate synthase
LKIDAIAQKIKDQTFKKSSFPNEVKIISELIDQIPHGSNLMISNSLPIRDFDLISTLDEKKINVYHNRGASGIDGIISTALGIAKSSRTKTYLIIGDLAFYYDMNSLFISKKYNIPLTIVLINNNGGRIFEILPISEYKNVFETYFATPHNLNFSNFIKAFEGNYFKISSWENFGKILKSPNKKGNFSVLEFKTNSKKSLAVRRKYYDKVIAAYNKNSKKLQ